MEKITKEEQRTINNYIACSSCDNVLDCKERGKHDKCINYKPMDKGGEELGRQRVDKPT